MELFAVEFLHSQIFWVAVAFAVLLGIMSKFVVPAVAAVLDARIAQVKGDLNAAESARAEAQKVLAEYQAQMAAARKEAATLVSTSRAEAEALAAQRMAQVDADIARKTDDARKAIEAAKAEAMRSIRSEVAEVAVAMTEKLLGQTVDAKLAAKLTDEALKKSIN